MPKEYRKGIYFLLDDGWDVPFDTDEQQSKAPFGLLILDGEKPVVLASQNNKTKAYCVSTLKRTFDMNCNVVIAADITIFPEELNAPIGIFGYYKNLIIEFNKEIPKNAKVYAQCLLEDNAQEVTEFVEICGKKIKIDGKKLRSWGRKENAIGFCEDPALVIQII